MQLELRRKRDLASTGFVVFRGAESRAEAERRAPAGFVRVRVPVEAEECKEARRRGEAEAVTRWLVHDCGVGVPSVLISITGGAQDFRLPPN